MIHKFTFLTHLFTSFSFRFYYLCLILFTETGFLSKGLVVLNE